MEAEKGIVCTYSEQLAREDLWSRLSSGQIYAPRLNPGQYTIYSGTRSQFDLAPGYRLPEPEQPEPRLVPKQPQCVPPPHLLQPQQPHLRPQQPKCEPPIHLLNFAGLNTKLVPNLRPPGMPPMMTASSGIKRTFAEAVIEGVEDYCDANDCIDYAARDFENLTDPQVVGNPPGLEGQAESSGSWGDDWNDWQ